MCSPFYSAIKLLFFIAVTTSAGLAVSASELSTAVKTERDGCSFSGSFQQSKELDGLKRPLLSSGILYYHCELGVIWKTVEPISQSLVLLNAGPNYLVDEQGINRLKGRKSSLLGDMIKAFISNDFDSLRKHFEVVFENPMDEGNYDMNSAQEIELLPKRKQLKRVFERIKITTRQHSQIIQMIDRKGATTTIHATKNQSQIALSECITIESINERECALLQEKLGIN